MKSDNLARIICSMYEIFTYTRPIPWIEAMYCIGKYSSPTEHMGYVKKIAGFHCKPSFRFGGNVAPTNLDGQSLDRGSKRDDGGRKSFQQRQREQRQQNNKINKCSTTRILNTKGGEQEGDEGVYLELGTCVWIRPIWWKKSTMKSHRRKLHKPAWSGWKFYTWNLSMERDLPGLKGPKCGLVVVLVCTVSGMKKREGVLAPNWFLILRSWRNFPVILDCLLRWCFFRLYHGIHHHLAPPFWENIVGSLFPFASRPVANPSESTKKNKLSRVYRGWNPTQLYGKLR